MTTRSAIFCALMGLTCLALAGAARAQNQATFGGQWWTQSAPEAAFQQFREVPQGGFLESYFLADSLHRYQFSTFGTHALLQDQAAGLRLDDGARWWLGLDYRQIPHLISLVTRTAYDEVSSGVFRLPDSLQALNQRNPGAYNQTMTDLLKTAHPVQAGFRTDVANGRLGLRPARGWQIEVTGQRRERSGHLPYGGPFGFNSTIELPAPINQRMWDGDATASYVRNRLSVQASAGFSAFQNRTANLNWDNPKELTDITGGSTSAGNGTSQGLLALPPDNRVVRGSVGLGLRLPRQAAFSATVGLSRSTQDAAWLPFTLNQAILAANPQIHLDSLATRSTGAKATALTQDYRLTGRIVPRLHGTLRFHQYHYDNQTPVHVLPGLVLLDQTFEATDLANPEVNRPYGNKQTVYGGDLDLEVMRGVGLSGTYERRVFDRTLREVTKDNEDVVEVRGRATPLERGELEVAYHYGNRKLDQFSLADYEAGGGDTTLTEQPGLRRFDVADRRQNQVSTTVGWAFGERLDVSAQYSYAKDDYPDSPLGLQRGTQNMVTADATLHLAPKVDLSGGYGYALLDTRMESNTSGKGIVTADDSTNWFARIKDRNIFVYVEGQWRAQAKLTLSVGYVFSRDLTTYDLTGTLNTNDASSSVSTKPRVPATNLPSTYFRHHTITAEARYRLMSDTDVAARYGYEQYVVNDFAVQGIPLLGVSVLSPSQTAVYLADNALDYRAHELALLATRRF